MGVFADVIKVMRSAIFKKELKNGGFSVSQAENATVAKKATRISSLGAASDNVARNVWFSDSEDRGLPRRDDDFKYNPSTNTLIVENVDGNAKSATYAMEAGTSGKVVRGNNVSLTIGTTTTSGAYVPQGKTIDDITYIAIDAKEGPLELTGHGQLSSDSALVGGNNVFNFVCISHEWGGVLKSVGVHYFSARVFPGGSGDIYIEPTQATVASMIDSLSPAVSEVGAGELVVSSAYITFFFK